MVFTTIGLIAGAASSAYTSINGAIRARQARKAIAEIERNRIQYENNYNNTQVSTLGADLQKEQLRQTNVTLIGNMRAGGSRAMIGALPTLIANNNDVSRQIGANLDEQQKKIDFAAADYQNQIQEVYDQRQRDALIGYGTELNASRQDVTTGMNNIAGIGMAMARLRGENSEVDNISTTETEVESTDSNFTIKLGGQGQNSSIQQPVNIGGQGYTPTPFTQYIGQNWQEPRYVYQNPRQYGTNARLNQYKYQ